MKHLVDKILKYKILIGVVSGMFLIGGLIICFYPENNQTKETFATSDLDENYDSTGGNIELSEFVGTVLEETDDAGLEYVEETLFLGDSNTAAFLKNKDENGKPYVTKNNSIGVVGMGIDAIGSLPCLDLATGRVTMVKAVSLLQPKRVIITFGTNNLYGNSTDAKSFIERYTKQLKAIEEAYPSIDIIVNSIPPVTKNRTYTNVSMIQIDAYNKAIVKMCEENDWKYLNSSEVLKDTKTGYAKDEYMMKDGLHFSNKGIDVLFKYIRTHAYISEDDRPKPLLAIPTIIGVPSGLIQINPLTKEEFSEEPVTPEIQCGENAYHYEGNCYCNEGYEGDPQNGCTLKVEPTVTSTPNCGENATYNGNLNACVCHNENETWNGTACVSNIVEETPANTSPTSSETTTDNPGGEAGNSDVPSPTEESNPTESPSTEESPATDPLPVESSGNPEGGN